jgi:hypothetical protein
MASALRVVQSVEAIADHRARFDLMERALQRVPQVDNQHLSLREYVSGGMYCREITIPKGVLLTGRVYKFDHLEIMVRGKIDILSADGELVSYEGFNVIPALSGKRQAGYAHEETVWLTVNRVPNIDVSQMLDHTTVLTYSEYEAFHRAVNQTDYLRFLGETGLTQDQMDAVVNIDDVVGLPPAFDAVHVAESETHGMGLFSSVPYVRGDLICPARIGDNRTIAGRYTNHAFHPNAEIVDVDGIYYLQANRPIPAGAEIFLNYRDVLEYRHSRGDL